MAWISASLAFAVTMMILSMVSSVLVETIHRLFGMREEGLRLLLGQFFDRVLAPAVRSQGYEPDSLKGDFLNHMTLNRAPGGLMGNNDSVGNSTWKVSIEDAPDHDRSMINRFWSGRRLGKLDAESFMSRLATSDLGDAVHNIAENSPDADLVLGEYARRFAAFGEEARVFFGRRARLLSVVASILVAYGMYVHPMVLFKTYMANPAVAEAVINMRESVIEKYKSGAGADGVDPEAARKMTNDAINDLETAGVPIGWTPQRMADAGFRETAIGIPLPDQPKSIQTLIWLLLGGLLVGLGGPFWYDVVNALSNIRAITGGANKSGGTGGAEKTDAAAPSTDSAVERFKAAIAEQQALAQSTSDFESEQAVG
jgi:hypothetical protein